MYSSPFLQKKTDGALCSARDSGLPTPFPYSKQNRKCDASRSFIDCNPQKARRRKLRQQGTAHSCTAQKAKVYSLLTRTAGCSFPSSNKAFKKRVFPSHRNTTLSARKASFTASSIAELHFCCTKIVIF